jgi:hypothetical protein
LGPLALHATATGADPFDGIVACIVAFDAFAASNLGLTALPTIAPGSVGGLPVTHDNGLVSSGTFDAVSLASFTIPSADRNKVLPKMVLVVLSSGGAVLESSSVGSDYNSATGVGSFDPPLTTGASLTGATYRLYAVPGAPVTSLPAVNVKQVNGTNQTAGDLAALMAASAIRAAVGLAAANLDTQLAQVAPGAIRSAVGLAAANLDTQLAQVTPSALRAAVGLAAANLDTQFSGLPASVRDQVFARAFHAVKMAGLTFEELVALMAVTLLGSVSGLNTNAPNFKNLAGAATAVAATTDANGNRSAVTLTPTAVR